MNFLKSFDFFIFTFIRTVTKLFAISTKLPDLPPLTSHSGVTNRGNNIIRLWHSWKIEKKNEMIIIYKYAVQVEPIQNKSKKVLNAKNPSFIYSHIFEHEFFCLGRFGSSGISEQLLRVGFFSTFCVQKNLKITFLNIDNSYLEYCSVCTKKISYIFL